MRILRLILALFAAVALLALPAQADDRDPVPPAEEVAKSTALIKDLFKADYAKTKPADRSALAAKLLQQVAETKEDAARYALLKEARDLAAKGGDGATAMRAADELARQFRVPAGEVRAAVADQVAFNVPTPAAARSAAEALLAAADAARLADEVPAEVTLARAADTAARKAQSATLAKAAGARLREAELLKIEADKVKEQLAALKANPDDPAANAAVGRFRLVHRQDWDAAIPMLAKGSDEKLRAVAAEDVKASQGGDDEKLAAADAWYAYAATADGAAKPVAQVRAYHWYALAAPNLTGLSKVKVDKRLAELAPVAGAKTDRLKLWVEIRRAIADGKVKKWDTVGGAFTQDTFEELPPLGGILIGFRYTTTGGGRYPGVVQAIYLTSHGEVGGPVYGTPGKGEVVRVTKAKPGYAVGAIYTRGGGGIDAIKPIYMRITDRGLDTQDSYEGTYIGGTGGGEATFGGDGNFIVGLHGKVNTQKGTVQAISPVTVTLADGDASSPRPKRRKK